jgi:hypothetical protein
VKKLAENAQTVFTESSCYRQHINGLANANKSHKKNQKQNSCNWKAQHLTPEPFLTLTFSPPQQAI